MNPHPHPIFHTKQTCYCTIQPHSFLYYKAFVDFTGSEFQQKKTIKDAREQKLFFREEVEQAIRSLTFSQSSEGFGDLMGRQIEIFYPILRDAPNILLLPWELANIPSLFC